MLDKKQKYDEIKYKIKTTNDKLYELVLPIRTELMGGRKTPDDIGQIGKLREIKDGLDKSESKYLLLITLRNIELLDKWSEHQIEYLEKHIEELKKLIDELFGIIKIQNEKVGEKIVNEELIND